MTKAHVIPQTIGGKLFAYYECKACNELMGHGLEAALVGDPAVHSAAENVAASIPKLIRRMRRRKVFVARSDSGIVVRAVPYEDGKNLKVIQTQQRDGSRTAATDEIQTEIETTLRRRMFSPQQVAEELRRLDEAPLETPVDIGGQFVVRKGAVEGFGLAFDEPMVPDVALLGIAYRYLAGCIGSVIYDSAFQPVRDAITTSGGSRPGVWRVVSYLTRKPGPWHGLAVEQIQPHVIVYVRLFGDLIWRVHFEQVAMKTKTGVPYRIDLTNGTEHIGG